MSGRIEDPMVSSAAAAIAAIHEQSKRALVRTIELLAEAYAPRGKRPRSRHRFGKLKRRRS